MNRDRSSLPDALRVRIARELRPVRPIHPPWLRTVMVASLVLVVTAGALTVLSLRADLRLIPTWLSWGGSWLELVLGVVLIAMALREAVPGRAVPAGIAWPIMGGGVVLEILVGVVTRLYSPGAPPAGGWALAGITCLSHDTLFALPVFVLTSWLVFRAWPLRAPMAGLLGGGGAALGANGVIHLLCPITSLSHVLVWHTGAVLGFMAIGWGLGRLWSLRQRRRG